MKQQQANLYLMALSALIFCLSVTDAQAQTIYNSVEELDLPLDNQVQLIGEIESKNSAEWNFATGQGELSKDTYQLQKSSFDVRFIEQDIPRWRNTGDEEDYSILVDIYKNRNSLNP